MKRITLFMAVALLQLFVTAQSKLDINSINDGLKNIPYIFEGYVIDTKPYMGDENGTYYPPDSVHWNNGYKHLNGNIAHPYFSIQMQVCKILRGKNLNYDTVEIVIPVPNFAYNTVAYLQASENGPARYAILGGGVSHGATPMFCHGENPNLL